MKHNEVKDSVLKESKKIALHYMKTLIDVAREPFLILDADLRVLSANPIFYQTFEVAPQETENEFIYKLGNGQWNIPELRRLLEEVLPEKKDVKDYDVTHVFETIGKKTILLNAGQIDAVQLIILAMEDITINNEFDEKIVDYTKELEAEVVKLKKEISDLKK
jgi:nitrogen-specific signal transduction histidine kinase